MASKKKPTHLTDIRVRAVGNGYLVTCETDYSTVAEELFLERDTAGDYIRQQINRLLNRVDAEAAEAELKDDQTT